MHLDTLQLMKEEVVSCTASETSTIFFLVCGIVTRENALEMHEYHCIRENIEQDAYYACFLMD